MIASIFLRAKPIIMLGVAVYTRCVQQEWLLPSMQQAQQPDRDVPKN